MGLIEGGISTHLHLHPGNIGHYEVLENMWRWAILNEMLHVDKTMTLI